MFSLGDHQSHREPHKDTRTRTHALTYLHRQRHSWQKINSDMRTYKHEPRQICEHFHRVIIKRIRTFESRELESPAG